MDKDELFKLNSEITDLEIKLAKLKSKRKQLKDNIDYLVGCCLNRSKFYYKVLSINKVKKLGIDLRSGLDYIKIEQFGILFFQRVV